MNEDSIGSEDTTTIDNWAFLAAMPYLAIKEPCETEYFRFLRGNDPQLEPFKRKCEAIKVLLHNFCEMGGQKKIGSALLLSIGAFTRPELIVDAAVSIRNAYAICCISRGWQRTVGALNCHGNLFADQYDFYPLFPDKSGKALLSQSPAQNAKFFANKFSGLLYPDVPFEPILGPPTPDPILWPILIECWKRYYISNEDTWSLRAIFRSLAHAFRGARMPKGSDIPLFDYGIQLGLWYSAMECLLRPETELVDIAKVITFLGKRRWNNKRLDGTVRQLIRQRPMDLNFVQRVCKEAYDLRNAFLHGNPVSLKDLTAPKSMSQGPLNLVFPLIYQVAVEEFAFENSFIQRPDPEEIEKLFQAGRFTDAIALSFSSKHMEDALCTFLLGLNLP